MQDFFFVQIGANDGVGFDPFHPFVVQNAGKVRGIVVEPMKDAFEQLKRTYAPYSNIIPINAAIHNTATEMELHRVDPSKLAQLPDSAKGIASFNKDHHKIWETPDECMISEKVPCMTLPELLARHGINRIDLLLTHTEGYDYDIVMAIDFDRLRPTFIQFEHGLPDGVISNKKVKQLIDRLYGYDYLTIMERCDGIAYQRNFWDM